KARILERRESATVRTAPRSEDLAAFGLIETLAVAGGAPRHLELHLDRLEASAAHFAIPLRREGIRDLLLAAARSAGDAVLRLHLDLAGTGSITTRPLPAAGETPVRLAIDERPRDPDAPE